MAYYTNRRQEINSNSSSLVSEEFVTDDEMDVVLGPEVGTNQMQRSGAFYCPSSPEKPERTPCHGFNVRVASKGAEDPDEWMFVRATEEMILDQKVF
jgi:hypothetical protein